MDHKKQALKELKEKAGIKEEFNYNSKKINFIEGDSIKKSWKDMKCLMTYNMKKKNELLFIAHKNDRIIGKPILAMETKQTISLITKTIKKKEENKNIKYKFFDESIDKRYDGYIDDVLSFDFWVYRVVFNGKEYYLFSEKKLGNELYNFVGMEIKMSGFSDISKTFKCRSLSNVFIVGGVEPSVKIMSKRELIELTKHLKKKYKFGGKEFREFVFTHEDGNIYDHTDNYAYIRISQLLSGKYEGYPLHVMEMGPGGTGKTIEQECHSFKFGESILEAANSTPKALVPSFKEKPANPGFILKSVRVALVDELMKMIDNVSAQSQYNELIKNYLNQLNFILEHKERTIGSGNDNTLTTKATAKVLFSTNPLQNKSNFEGHIGLIDSTTLSRILVICQDKNEQNLIHKQEYKKNNNTYAILHIKEKGIIYYRGVIINIYLTLYDSCYNFNTYYKKEKIKKIFEDSKDKIKSPILRDLWVKRGLHHTTLLLDGITKYRCLFFDYDDSFKAKEEDYKKLEQLLEYIINSWDTNFLDFSKDQINISYERVK